MAEGIRLNKNDFLASISQMTHDPRDIIEHAEEIILDGNGLIRDKLDGLHGTACHNDAAYALTRPDVQVMRTFDQERFTRWLDYLVQGT